MQAYDHRYQFPEKVRNVASRKKVELHKNTTSSNFLGPTLEYTKRLHQQSYDLQVAIGKT